MITTEIEVALLPSLLSPPAVPPRGIAVVIDTLRFTTAAIQALTAGSSSVSVASDIDTARHLAANQAPTPLLCGERHCRPIPGFDLGNSPSEYMAERIAGKSLLFTTTNGTLAVAACQAFETCLLAAMVNRTAVAQAIVDSGLSKCTIVCAGTDGQVALEDVLTAGAIIDALMNLTSVRVAMKLQNDAAHLASETWRSCTGGHAAASTRINDCVHRYFLRAAGGLNLVEQGYAPDLGFASRVDSLTNVPTRSPLLTKQLGCQTFT